MPKTPPQPPEDGKPPKKRSVRRLGIGSGKPPPDKKLSDEADKDKKIREKVNAAVAGGFLLWRETDGALDELLDHIVAGGHLAGFGKARGFSYTSMVRWLRADADREALYERAREERTHILVDEIVELADNVPGIPVEVGTNEDGSPKFENLVTKEAIAQQKLKIESRQWYAGRLNKRYSERHIVDTTVTDKRDLSDESLLKRMEALGVTGVSLTPEPPKA